MTNELIPIKRLKFDFFLIALIVGFSNMLSVRDAVDPDGVSYLDIASAYYSGDFKDAINSYWSPLYSLVVGLPLKILHVDPSFESTLVHIINFLIFMVAFFCFDFFLSGLIELNKSKEKENLKSFPEWAWVTLGYSIFIWSSMNLVAISKVTPDMFLSAFVCLISGFILKTRKTNNAIFSFMFLGVVLGLAYLTKAVMFPLAFIYLFIVLFSNNNFSKNWLKVLISLLAFSLISSPFIYLISKQKGHLTYGETGKINYAWYLDESTYECWKEGSPNCSGVIHPAKKIFDEPKVIDFSAHLKGSYPMWYDPTFWFEGLKPKFTFMGQMKVLAKSFNKYFNLFFLWQGILISFLLVFIFLTDRAKYIVKDISEQWFLILPSLFVLLLYSLIIIQYRYIGPFMPVFWCGLFSALKFADYENKKKLIGKLVICLSFLLIFTSIVSQDVLENGKNASAVSHSKIAKYLLNKDINSGDKVAVVGVDYGIYWTHLAMVHIVSEIPSEEEKNFWASDLKTKNVIYQKLKAVGAKILVAEHPPSSVSMLGWKNIQGTGYYFYSLK